MAKDLFESINTIRANVAPYVLSMNESLEKIRPVIQAYALETEKAAQKFAPLAEAIREAASKAVSQAIKWQEEKKIEVSYMAEKGWFPNWYTFFSHPEQDDSLDSFMISHIDECWEPLKEKMIELCPNRSHIFDVIFDLHEKENYIASIPLIFTQADGICGEEFTYFFIADQNTKKKASDDILEKVDCGEIQLNFFTDFLLEPFKTKLQISSGASKATKVHKSKGPNRHGIVHGSRKHLDYGNKVNGYKAMSFLAFLIYTTKDEFKKT